MATDGVTLRDGKPDDAPDCGRVCFEAFRNINERHGFPNDMPGAEGTGAMLAGMLEPGSGFLSIVAEGEGRIVGSNFADVRSSVWGVGPLSVDPEVQDSSVGRRLMQGVLDRAREQGVLGVRLMQDAFHNRSFALYCKMGYEAKTTACVLQGPAIAAEETGSTVRPARSGDLEACNALCEAVHGHDRGGELEAALQREAASVVERDGRITGYTSAIAFGGHSVAETNDDLKALIASAPAFGGPGFFVPSGNGELLRWCFDNGLQIVKMMTLMSVGFYQEPRGAWLPSVLY